MEQSLEKYVRTTWILWLVIFSINIFVLAYVFRFTVWVWTSLDDCQTTVQSAQKEVEQWIEQDSELFERVDRVINMLEECPESGGSETSKHTPYEDYILEVCGAYPSVDPDLVKAIIKVESNFDPYASHPADSCVGLMQVSTKWHTKRAQLLGVRNLWDPYGNILTGVDILNDLLKESNGDVEWALTVYNAGYKVANSCRQRGETWGYAREVLSLRDSLKNGGTLDAKT